MADHEATSVFERDGDLFVPTPRAISVWDPTTLHGGAPTALLAMLIDRLPAPAEMRVARLTVELMRPVPYAPLSVTTEVVRDGKRIQLVEAVIHAARAEIVRARALRLRAADVALPETYSQGTPRYRWEDASPFDFSDEPRLNVGFFTAVELRRAHGAWLERGPSAHWFRLRIPLVAGELNTPLIHVTAASDFANGLSSELSFHQYRYVNPDLTIALLRAPSAEWVLLDAVTRLAPNGSGIARATLHDEHGELGHVLQTLFVDTR